MQRVFALLIICSLFVPCLGCGGQPKPAADPNFKPTTNPSDIIVPEQFKKGGMKKL